MDAYIAWRTLFTITIYFAGHLTSREIQIIIDYFSAHPNAEYICMFSGIRKCVEEIHKGEEWVTYHNPSVAQIFNCVYGEPTSASDVYSVARTDNYAKEMNIFSYAHESSLEFNICKDNDIISLDFKVFLTIVDKCKSSGVEPQIIRI